MKKLNKKGFTLIELMIVIAIIAILAAILVPNFVKARAQGQLTACKSNLKNIGTACEMYAADHNGRYPKEQGTTFENGEIRTLGYMKVVPRCPLTPGDPYNYASRSNPDYYYLQCQTGNHQQAGVAKDRVTRPEFDSAIGLICPLEQESGDTAIKTYSVTDLIGST